MVRTLKVCKPCLVFVLLGLGAIALTACNTSKGLGKDVENLGENIQDAAD